MATEHIIKFHNVLESAFTSIVWGKGNWLNFYFIFYNSIAMVKFQRFWRNSIHESIKELLKNSLLDQATYPKAQ